MEHARGSAPISVPPAAATQSARPPIARPTRLHLTAPAGPTSGRIPHNNKPVVAPAAKPSPAPSADAPMAEPMREAAATSGQSYCRTNCFNAKPLTAPMVVPMPAFSKRSSRSNSFLAPMMALAVSPIAPPVTRLHRIESRVRLQTSMPPNRPSMPPDDAPKHSAAECLAGRSLVPLSGCV